MRWPFRRKDSAAAEPAPAVSAVREPVPPTVPRPSRQWATLPPLPVTVKPAAPLIMGPAPVLPPLPGHRTVSGPPVAPAAGRVEGLATSLPTVAEPPLSSNPTVSPASSQPEPAPMVHRKVRSGPPAPVAPLTDATGPYVGEPREPAEPYRAPGWLRYAPSWLQQGIPGMDLGLGVDLPTSPPPPPEPPRPAPRPMLPPSKIIEAPAAAEEVEESTSDTPAAPAPLVLPVESGRPRRRPNLGQSRRLGLGAPLKHVPHAEPVDEPAPEPPPAPPQPVQVTPAPTPVAAAPVAPPVESTEDGSDDEEPPPPPPPSREPPVLVHRPAEPGRRDDVEAPEPPVSPVAPSIPVTPAPVPVVRQAPQAPPTAPVSLVYRSAPGRRDEPARQANTVRRATTITPPASVAAAITSRHGVDVSNVLVHRGPDVSTAARSLGARAFTRGGEVYLPDEAGSLDTPKARGLLAHELVHAVQQRTLGPALPALSTPAGAALEAEAVAAEHEHSGQGTHTHAAPQPLVHPALTQVITQAARTVGVQLAPLESSSSFSFTSEPTPAPPQPSTSDTGLPLSEPVRQEMDLIAEANAIRVFEQWTNPDLGGNGFEANPVGGQAFPGATVESFPPSAPSELPAVQNSAAEQEMANQILHVINLDRASKGEPTLSALDEATLEQVRRTIAEQNAAATTRMALYGASSAIGAEAAYRTELANSQQVERTEPGRPASADTAMTFDAGTPAPAEPDTAAGQDSALRDGQVDIERIDLEELSTRLYDKIRSRLRLELLVDRERSGLLSDFR